MGPKTVFNINFSHFDTEQEKLEGSFLGYLVFVGIENKYYFSFVGRR